MRELIRIVQAHMDEYGVSEAEVARRIGASPQTVNTWRNGEMKQLPRQQYLEALAELTNTPYRTVLSAALVDTGYVTVGTEEQSDHLSTMIELSFLADDVDSANGLFEPQLDDTDEIENYISEVENLSSAAEYLSQAVHAAVLNAVGGDTGRLRQIKREIRRFNRAKQLNALKARLRADLPPSAGAAARAAPPDYRKGRGDQGDAGGEENQDPGGDIK